VYVPLLAKECVAFLCGSLPGDDGEPDPIGTCFFVRGNQRFYYIITAKHVVKKLQVAEQAYLRVNKGKRQPGDPGLGVIYIPTDLSRWLDHPDPNVDLAVLPLHPKEDLLGVEPLVAGGTTKSGSFRIAAMHVEDIRQAGAFLRSNNIPWPPNEGEDVFFVGLMTVFPGRHRNLPVVRRGSVALIPNEPIRGAYGESEHYLIESQAYKGNSGAPVWVLYFGNVLFPLGVLSHAYPQLEELDNVPNAERAYYNFGISLIVPMEKILDIIDSEAERRRRGETNDELTQGAQLAGDVKSDFTREDFGEALKKVSRRRPKSSPPGQASSGT